MKSFSLQLNAFFHPHVEGVVMQSFGTGNFPSRRKDLLRCLKEKVVQGVIIINISQCQQGGVSTTYAAGKVVHSLWSGKVFNVTFQVLEDVGVVTGYDMTAEAAFAKLCYVLRLPTLTIAEKKEVSKRCEIAFAHKFIIYLFSDDENGFKGRTDKVH